MKAYRQALGLLTLALALGAQADDSISDNSFLIEEAYNQEAGVVQHISVFQRLRGGDWAYGFTQEWPLFGQRHQLSYTLPLQRAPGEAKLGLGDVAINYRCQLTSGRVASAPRLTLLIPSGDERRGYGSGAVGYQLALPVSAAVSPRLDAHANAGFTLTPSARSADRARATARAFNLGASAVFKTRPSFNALVEAVYVRTEDVVGPNATQWSGQAFISPGVRWAYNFNSGLQIVPGLAIPIGIGPSDGERGVLVYLSFEHPFRKAR